jgi:ribosome biogenesis GTPase / thiamine phosphate phosphatase
VNIEEEIGQVDIAVIHTIEKRRNYVVRVSPHNDYKQHIIASNIDQALLIVTFKQPRTSLGFIDRFLVTCSLFDVPAIIVFNKQDLIEEDDLVEFEAIQAMYKSLGYGIITTSCETEAGMNDFNNLLKDKVSLLSGHSGVGKSTLINKVLPDLELRTLEVSDWSGKGMHTTTYAAMFDLPQGGQLIDTPGIRELAIAHVKPEELSGYFVDIKPFIQECKYNNCIHQREPGCAVLKAVEAYQIHPLRYQSYLAIYDSLPKKNY